MTASALWFAVSTAAAQSVSGREVLDVDEAAALLRVKPEVVRALAESQRIPARRVGDVWRFWHAGLLEWLKGDPVAGAVSQLSGRSTGLDRIETLGRESRDLTARGVRPEPPPPTQTPLAATPQAPSTPPTVGERLYTDFKTQLKSTYGRMIDAQDRAARLRPPRSRRRHSMRRITPRWTSSARSPAGS